MPNLDIVRHASFSLKRYWDTFRATLIASKQGCFFGFHDWGRWRTQSAFLQTQKRRCRQCHDFQWRERPYTHRIWGKS